MPKVDLRDENGHPNPDGVREQVGVGDTLAVTVKEDGESQTLKGNVAGIDDDGVYVETVGEPPIWVYTTNSNVVQVDAEYLAEHDDIEWSYIGRLSKMEVQNDGE